MIDIVIPSFALGKNLINTILSIAQNTIVEYNLIIIPGKRSASININIGIKRSKSKYICICDDDIFVTKNWLLHLIKVLDSDKTIGVVSPKICRLNGKPYFIYEKAPNNKLTQAYLGATCILCRNVGIMMDEGYVGAWWNDTDFIMQYIERGFKTVIDGYIRIRHVHGALNANTGTNSERFFNKWPQIKNVEQIRKLGKREELKWK